MRRDIVLDPTGTVSPWSSSVNPATSPYPWLGTGSIQVHQAFSDYNYGLGSVTGYEDTWVYAWGGDNNVYHVASYEPGPTLATFEKLKMETQFDYYQYGPNNWWFPPDNAFGPGVHFLLRNRAKSGYHTGTSWSIGQVGPPDLTDLDAYNSRPSKGGNWQLTPVMTWELTSHPEGGPFTLEDINNLAAGVGFHSSNGPNGKTYDPSQGSFFYVRVPYVKLTLTVQDLGGYVRAVRHNASATLRMKRKARNTISMHIPAYNATKEIGEVVNIAHSRGADSEGEGWGAKPMDRRNGWLSQRTYWPEALKVVDECYDLHDFNCEAWAAFRIPIPWTPELSGMGYLDQGGEFTFTRAQDGWSLRPGDGAALRVLENYLNLSEEGLAIHTDLGTELALHNANLADSDWASGTSGGASYSTQTEQPMADELGYTSSPKLSISGTPGDAYKSQTFSLSAGDVVNVRVRVRNISVSDPETKFLEVAFYDNSGNYWNEGTRSWDASPVYNPIPADAAFGEVIFDQVSIQNTETHTLKVGRLSSTINSCSFILALVNVEKDSHGTGTPLVTLDSTIAREPDVFTMDNASPYTFWHRARGTAIIEFKPFWRTDSLPASTEKQIILASHNASYDRIYFDNDTTDHFTWDRVEVGGTKSVSIDLLDAAGDPIDISRANYVRLFMRWLDSGGWRQHAPYEVLFGYALYDADETFIAYHETTAVWDAPDSEVEDYVELSGLDGWVRWFEVKNALLTGAEAVWRR